MRRLITTSLVVFGLLTSNAAAQEPGWWGVVIAPKSIRPQIEATPIIYRPYRPFHFYGNTIRRKYYRGTVVPAPRDLVGATAALIRQH
ncbi:MAG: hypothetical protein H8E66_34810 [Planctomycetes bacterium]|nr:hypothetical protein [Planctomycetota bacterium]